MVSAVDRIPCKAAFGVPRSKEPLARGIFLLDSDLNIEVRDSSPNIVSEFFNDGEAAG